MSSKINLFKNASRIKREAVSTSIFSILGKGVSLVIPFFIGAWFGTTAETDAFFLAYSLLIFVAATVGSIFETLLVPFVSDIRTRSDDVGLFIGNLIVRSTIYLFTILLFLLVLVRPLITQTTQFSGETIHLVWTLVLEMVAVVVFLTWTSILNGALNCYRVFFVSAVSPGIRSVTVICAAFFLKDHLGIHALPLGYVLGEALRFFVGFYFFAKKIGSVHLTTRRTAIEMRPFLKSFIPQSAGLVFINLMMVVDQIMASWVGPGSLSIYAYADRLYTIPYFLIATGVVPVVFSYWADAFSRSSADFSWQKIRGVMTDLTVLTVFFSILIVLLQGSISRFAFGRGVFPDSELHTVGGLLALLGMGFPFQVLNLLCVRVLIIYKCNIFYMAVGFLRLVLDVILNYLFMIFMGIYGIALSTSLLNLISAVVLYAYAKRLNQKHSERAEELDLPLSSKEML
ncbi:MAG: polysaccharide biosynthesis C-terminal domain-containing protein [Candidatus Omnitrophica bacterium]|nr:polysaccharide biosynthesis C-terminal domain-containing protein [Candidatus Omnitrophota bacterium]